MNVKLLRRIQRIIVKRYKQIDMGSWFDTNPDHEVPMCGTTACIAGWAVTLHRPSLKAKPSLAAKFVHSRSETIGFGQSYYMTTIAVDILGLGCEQAARLFYISNWPEQFHNRILEPNVGTKRYAKIVAQRIDHFIATGGKE